MRKRLKVKNKLLKKRTKKLDYKRIRNFGSLDVYLNSKEKIIRFNMMKSAPPGLRSYGLLTFKEVNELINALSSIISKGD